MCWFLSGSSQVYQGPIHLIFITPTHSLSPSTTTHSPLKDHALPYMNDKRHTPDTLFLVMEEDFRIYKDVALKPDTETKSQGRKFVIPQEDEGCTRMTDVLASYVARMEKTPLRGSTPLSPEPVAADIGEEAAGHGFYTRTNNHLQ